MTWRRGVIRAANRRSFSFEAHRQRLQFVLEYLGVIQNLRKVSEMKNTAVLFQCALFISTLLILAACKGSGTSTATRVEDAGSESGSPPVEDAGQDAGEVIEDAGKDSGPSLPEPSELGQPCWNEDVFETWHPNNGLSDCIEGLRCIGNDSESWCTKTCTATGAFNEDDPEIEGWCCGEITNPCAPQRYWLADSMSYFCIPRTAELAEQCDNDSEWTGENRLCAPVCSEEVEVFKTKCAPYEQNAAFCTFQCDPVNGDADCLIEPAFEGGCCGEIMGGHWCLIPELCP